MFPNQQRSPHSLGPQSKIPQGLAGSGTGLNQSILGHAGQSTSRYSDYSPMSNKVNQSSAGGKYNYDYAGANGISLSGVSPTPAPQSFNANLGVGLTASGIGLGEQLHLQNELKLSQISNQGGFCLNGQRPTLADFHSQHQLPLTLQNQNRIRDAMSTESLRFQRPIQQQASVQQQLSLQKENPLNVNNFGTSLGLSQIQQIQGLHQQQNQLQQSQQPATITSYLQQLQQQQQQNAVSSIDSNGNPSSHVSQNPLLAQAQIQQSQQQQLLALQQIQALQGQNPQQQLQQLRQLQQADMAKLLQASQQISQQQQTQGSGPNPQLQMQLQLLQLQQQQQLQQLQQQQTQSQVQPQQQQTIQNQMQLFMLQQMMMQQSQQQQANPQAQTQQMQQMQALLQQVQKQSQTQNTQEQIQSLPQTALTTPLESSRILNTSQPQSACTGAPSQNTQNSQQHQQFVQQYQQLNETLSQYRKLATMIGHQEAQKKEQLLQQQQQQQTLLLQQQQQQLQHQQQQLLQQQLQAKNSQVVPTQAQQSTAQTHPDLNQSILDNSRLLNASQMMTMINQDPNFNQSPIKGTQNSIASMVWPSMHQIDQSTNQILNKSLNNSNHEKSFASPSSQNQDLLADAQDEKANFKVISSPQEQSLKLDEKMQSSPTQDSQYNSTTPHSQRAPSHNPQSEADRGTKSAENNLAQTENLQLNHHQQSYASELDYETKFIEGDFDPSLARNHLFNPSVIGGASAPIYSNDFQSPSATQTLHLQQIHQQLASLSPGQQQILLNQSILSGSTNDQFTQQQQIEATLLKQQQQLIEQQQREILRLSSTLDPSQNFMRGLQIPIEMQSLQSSPENLPFLMEDNSILNQSHRSGASAGQRIEKVEDEYVNQNQTLQNYLDTSHISAQRVDTDATPRKDQQSDKNEQPISHQKLTFEEMLEKQLQQEEFQPDQITQESGQKVAVKKQFLRRGSQTASSLRDTSKSATKTYKYYADNFNTNGSNSQQMQQPQSPKGAKKVTDSKQLSTQKSPIKGHVPSAQKSGCKSAMRGRHSPKQASVSQSMNNSTVMAANNRPRSSQQQYEPKFNSKNEEGQPLRTTLIKAKQEESSMNSQTLQSSAPISDLQMSSNNQVLNQSIATLTEKGAPSSATPSQKHQTSTTAKGKSSQNTNSVKKNLNHQFNYHSKPNNQLENLRSSEVIPLRMDEQSQAAIAMLSERNSVAEFEQLEQECMNKYLQNQSMQILPTDAHTHSHNYEDLDFNYIESQSVREPKPNKGGIHDAKKQAAKKIKSPKGGKSGKKKRASVVNSPNKLQHNFQSNSQANSSQNTQSCQETLETPRSSINPNLSKSMSPTAMGKSHSQTQDSEQQRKLESKLQELENEIQRFKQEKAKVQTLQQEYEDQLDRVTREIEDFENRKELEVEELQTWKNEQMQELAQEKLGIEAEKLELETERQKLAEFRKALERQKLQEEEKYQYQVKCLEEETSGLLNRLKAYEDKIIEGEKEQRAREQEWEEEREQMMKVIEKEQREKLQLRRDIQQREEVEMFKLEEEKIKKSLVAERAVQTETSRMVERGVVTDIQGGEVKLVKELRSFQTCTEQVYQRDAFTTTMPKQPKEVSECVVASQSTQSQIVLSEAQQQKVLGQKLRSITKIKHEQVQAVHDELVPKMQQSLQTNIEAEKRDQILMTNEKVLRDAWTEDQQEQISVLAAGEVIFDLEIRRETSSSQTQANVLQSTIHSLPLQDAVSVFSRQQQVPVLLPIVNNSSTSSVSVSSSSQINTAQPRAQQVMNQNYRSALPIDTKKVGSSQGQSSPTASCKSTNRQSDNSASKISQTAASNQQVYQVKKQGLPSSHSQNRVLSAHSNNSTSQQNLLSQRSISQQQASVQEKTPVRQQQPVLQNQRSQDSHTQPTNEFKRVGTASTNKSEKDPQLQQPGNKARQQSQIDPQDDFMSSQQPRLTDSQVDDDEEEEEDDFDLKFPQEYHGKSSKPATMIEEITSHDGKKQRFFDNGKKEVIFSNGVRREVWPTGYSVVYFTNNDVKQTFPDHKVVYYFAEAKTTQTTFPNGLQVFKFSNNQIEKHFQDGTKEISFPDGTIKCLFPDEEEESIFPDGTIQKIEKSGVRIIEFPSGQRDTLYPDGTKVREFEDGSIKKIHPDGKIEFIQPGSLPHIQASAHKRQQAMHNQMPLQSQQQQQNQRPFSSGAATIVGGGSVSHGAVAAQKQNHNRLMAAAPQTSNRKK